MIRMWKISIWDGHSNNVLYRKGTYDYVTQSLRHLPPACIWSAS